MRRRGYRPAGNHRSNIPDSDWLLDTSISQFAELGSEAALERLLERLRDMYPDLSFGDVHWMGDRWGLVVEHNSGRKLEAMIGWKDRHYQWVLHSNDGYKDVGSMDPSESSRFAVLRMFKSAKHWIHQVRLVSSRRIREASSPRYHVTYAANLPGISRDGLLPMARSNFGGGYAGHSRDKVFLTDRDGVRYWASKLKDMADNRMDNPMMEGMFPVVLRVEIPPETNPRPDDASRRSDDVYVEEPIPGRNLEVWDPELGWTSPDPVLPEEMTDWLKERAEPTEWEPGWVTWDYDYRDLLPKGA